MEEALFSETPVLTRAYDVTSQKTSFFNIRFVVFIPSIISLELPQIILNILSNLIPGNLSQACPCKVFQEPQNKNKQTPWPLVRDRHLSTKFSANFCGQRSVALSARRIPCGR
jgi:hypothetical protein